MNDLVSKASTAYINAYGKTLMTFDERHLKGMTAAAKVLLEAALGEPSMAEIAMHDKANGYQPSRLKWSDINWYLAYRRARLLAPKTIESRVTVDDIGRVFIDGEIVATAVSVPLACMIMNGLIAEMKEKG